MSGSVLLPPPALDRSSFSGGVSAEDKMLSSGWLEAQLHYLEPVTRRTDSAALKFRALVDTWTRDTATTSSMTGLILHPAYQQVIGMGPQAIPYLLKELSVRPNHWFWALTSITGVNPVTQELSGDLPAMTRVWLDWGRARGYVY